MFIQNLLQQVFYMNIWLSSSSFLTWFHFNLESFKKISIFTPCQLTEILIGRGAKVLKTNIYYQNFQRGWGFKSENLPWGEYRYFLEQNNLFSWLFLSFKGSLPKVAHKCSFCTFLYILLFRLNNVTVNILFSADNLFCFSLPWDLHFTR